MTDNEKAPWTIKAVPLSTRDLANQQAKQAGKTVSEWLTLAVQNQADMDRRATVIPPGQTGQTRDVARLDPVPVQIDLVGLAQAVSAVTVTVQAAIETPALRGLSRDLAGLLRDQVRQARGVAPLRRRRTGSDDAESLP